MSFDPRPWNAGDVPPGPYLHGSRTRYQVGDWLHTSVVREDDDPDYDDPREMCFVTTARHSALDWACRRARAKLNHGVLFVYTVDLTDPEVDTNAHGLQSRFPHDGQITSVMARAGRVTAVEVVAFDDCPNFAGALRCDECRPSRP